MSRSKAGVLGSFHRHALRFAGVLLAATALAGCFPEEEKKAAEGTVSDPKNPIYFTYAEYPTQVSLVRFAQELGYWDKAGIRPKFVGGVDAGQLPALVGKGEVTFANFMFNRALAAVANGVDLKVIAAQSYTTRDEPHMTYFTRADSTISVDNLKELEGKTVGLASLGGCAEFILKDLLTKNGIDVKKVKFLTQAESLLQQSVENGSVALAVIHPPLNGVMRADKALKAAFSDYDNSQEDGGSAPISANGEFIRKYPAQTKEFVGIIAKTANWINANPDKAGDISAKVTGFSREYVTKYYYVNNLILDENQLQFWWGLLDRVGSLKPDQAKLKPSDIATNEYNPYAPSAALIASQKDNLKVLTATEY
ncbi:ABC transporter substrate-binding protein [Xanthobacter sp. V4C-4]|uniref:ABC transporter substrate-binding protein n=1 Tax=Xanthobacter cornucopiae TaxID=3119924 RepID=UPI00372A5BAF